MSDHTSSVDTSELKAGHAPATKVGGMRVSAPRPRHTSHGEDKNVEGQETSGENTNESGTKQGETSETQQTTDDNANEETSGVVANRTAGEMVCGTFVPIEKAFPTEAVKHIHEKPGTHPKHEAHGYSKQNDQRFINQPRKQ